MNRRYIDDHHIVARYLADQLEDAEREAFEDYLVEHPEVVQELEAVARFKVGLDVLRERGELNGLLTPTPWYRQRRYTVATAAALLLVTLGLFMSRTLSQQPVMAATVSELGPSSSGSLLDSSDPEFLVRVRSGAVDRVIDLPPTPQAIQLRLMLAASVQQPASGHRLVLSRIDGEATPRVIADIDGLRKDRDDYVTVYVSSERVQPGLYEIQVSGEPHPFVIAIR